MSQENVEIVRFLYRAWNDDQIDAALLLIHPEVEWQPSGVFPGMESVYRGHDGVRSFWRALKEPFERFTIDSRRLVPRDDWVLAELTFSAVGTQSGAHVTLDFFNAFLLRDGLVLRFISRRTYEALLEAVDAGGALGTRTARSRGEP